MARAIKLKVVRMRSFLRRAGLAGGALTVLALAASPFAISDSVTANGDPEFAFIGRYVTGLAALEAEVVAAEVVAYENKRMYVTNASDESLDIVNIKNPANPTLIQRVDLSSYGGAVTSVAVKNGIVAVAVQADVKTDPGKVLFLNTNGSLLAQVPVGAGPDMVTFSTLGLRLLVANEGEPSEGYAADPEGSVSIISVLPVVATGWLGWVPPGAVKTVSFADFNEGGPRHGELSPDVRIYGWAGSTVAQDLEPEYISVGPDLKTAYVTLQENNAVAIINILSGKVEKIIPLGLKDHSLPGNGLDPDNENGAALIANYPIFGMYEPDAIDSYRVGWQTYFVTANEGDAREYGGPGNIYNELKDLKDWDLDDATFPNEAALKAGSGPTEEIQLSFTGDLDGDGDLDQLQALGARSFTIWDSNGNVVFDSGDQFEQVIAAQYPLYFNTTNDETALDDRSDNKGPEPEAIVIGKVKNRTYAFIGLERQGGVMVYDITDPAAATFVEYINTRDYTKDPGAESDSGPEVLAFVDRSDSPTRKPLLLISNEISGTVAIIEID